MWWLYFVWIPYVIIYYITAAVWSKKLNDDPSSWKWFWAIVILQIAGFWPILAKYSKNLLFDAVLFDVIILLSYYVTLVWLGTGSSFTPLQWCACSMIVLGILIFKVTG